MKKNISFKLETVLDFDIEYQLMKASYGKDKLRHLLLIYVCLQRLEKPQKTLISRWWYTQIFHGKQLIKNKKINGFMFQNGKTFIP